LPPRPLFPYTTLFRSVHVDVQHLDRDLLADLHDLARVVDVLPGQLRHVHQTVDTAEVDERAEVDDGGHDTLADLALGERVEELADRKSTRLNSSHVKN